MMLESQRTAAKEQSLIETINIISGDNSALKEQIETIKLKYHTSKVSSKRSQEWLRI